MFNKVLILVVATALVACGKKEDKPAVAAAPSPVAVTVEAAKDSSAASNTKKKKSKTSKDQPDAAKELAALSSANTSAPLEVSPAPAVPATEKANPSSSEQVPASAPVATAPVADTAPANAPAAPASVTVGDELLNLESGKRIQVLLKSTEGMVSNSDGRAHTISRQLNGLRCDFSVVSYDLPRAGTKYHRFSTPKLSDDGALVIAGRIVDTRSATRQTVGLVCHASDGISASKLTQNDLNLLFADSLEIKVVAD